jgi:Mg2+/Co2+ transporter CorB
MFHAEDIPGEGDTIVIGDYTFTVMEAAQNKVETVKMHRKPMI